MGAKRCLLFRTKTEEVAGNRRKLYNHPLHCVLLLRRNPGKQIGRECMNEALYDPYVSSNELEGHVARMRDRRCICRALVGKPARKKTLGRPRLRWNVILK
jgi:hypothetical protein